MENLSPGGTWRLRTAEGWVAERAVDDPDEFFLERLEQDTCEFAGAVAGPERCVFVDALRVPRSASRDQEGCNSCTGPHALCKNVLMGECYAEVVPNADLTSSGNDVDDKSVATAVAASQKSGTPCRPTNTPRREHAEADVLRPCNESGGRDLTDLDLAIGQPPTRSLLARSVEVGDADAVTFIVELFVPGERAVAAAAAGGRSWRWGVVVGDFDIYLSSRCVSTRKERDNGGDCAAGKDAVLSENCGNHVQGQDGQIEDGEGSMHVVVHGPGGFLYVLPVCSAFKGRWMTLMVVARRSGESRLVCVPGLLPVDELHARRTDSARLDFDEVGSASASVAAVAIQPQQRQQQLMCTFSNPRFFRGDRVGCVGLYSKRSGPTCPVDNGGLPCRARHALVVLGSAEELPLPSLPRLRQLERLVTAEHKRRLAEPSARPLLVFAGRLRRLWSGEVPVPASAGESTVDGGDTTTKPVASVLFPSSSVAGVAPDAGSSAAGRPSCDRGTVAAPTLTVWQALLSPGRVALGTAVHLSGSNGRRSGGGGSPGGGPDVGLEEAALESGGPVQKRCLTAWEHPALQTPARFEQVPLPPPMSTQAPDGRGLWAWAPVPRSEAFVAIGLVFTASPEPPALKDVRCLLRELVKDAAPQKCKVSSKLFAGDST